MNIEPTRAVRLFRQPEGCEVEDRVAVEEPLEIRVNGKTLAVTMRTPGHDVELAAGFCFTEGVVDTPDDLERVEMCTQAETGNVVLATVSGGDAVSERGAQAPRVHTSHTRPFPITSACGICGSTSLDIIQKRVQLPLPTFVVQSSLLSRLPELMSAAQPGFARTGGLHAAGLFTPTGELRLLREDVGRHNAVDKIIGALLLSGQLPCEPNILLVSSRASFELVQKAAVAGIGFLAAVGAPTSLAVDAANRFGMTLVGFLRGDRYNVYAGSERVML